MGTTADIILAPARLTRMYADNLLKDIKPGMFARLATSNGKPVQSNHPAFVFGHLSVYPVKVATLLGQTGAANPQKFEELFKDGKPCLDDPEGTVYPGMEAILNHYRAGHDAAAAMVARASEADLVKPNPAEGRMKELFPTIGSAINFYLSGHPMSHLGQVSAWRRMVGIGPAM
jgi:hypothetical protein